MCLHIGAETIWPPFPDDSFRLIFKYENEYLEINKKTDSVEWGSLRIGRNVLTPCGCHLQTTISNRFNLHQIVSKIAHKFAN